MGNAIYEKKSARVVPIPTPYTTTRSVCLEVALRKDDLGQAGGARRNVREIEKHDVPAGRNEQTPSGLSRDRPTGAPVPGFPVYFFTPAIGAGFRAGVKRWPPIRPVGNTPEEGNGMNAFHRRHRRHGGTRRIPIPAT